MSQKAGASYALRGALAVKELARVIAKRIVLLHKQMFLPLVDQIVQVGNIMSIKGAAFDSSFY